MQTQVVNVQNPNARPSVEYRVGYLIIFVFLAFVLLARAMPTLTASVPSGDGALFYIMTNDVSRTGQIPLYTSFNGGYLPFVYPPAAFVFTALLSTLGIDIDVLFRFLPVIYYIILTLILFAFARRFGCDASSATLAALMFAAADPLPFQQLTGGGGIVRGLGFILALATCWSLDTMLASGRHRSRAGVLAGLALICHPSNAAFIPIFSIGMWSELRTRRGLSDLVIAGLIATAVCIPYLAFALRHGIEPFIRILSMINGLAISNDGLSYLVFTVVGHKAPYLWVRLLAPLAVVGMGRQLARHKYALPLIFGLLLQLPGQAYQVSWIFALLCGLGSQTCIGFLSRPSSPFSRFWRWQQQFLLR